MNLPDYTISSIPFMQNIQTACPVCKRPGKVGGRNVILYRQNATPISKCGIKLRYCRKCDIVYLNEKLLADALFLISKHFHINYSNSNYKSMLHPLLLSVKLENLSSVRTQIYSNYFTSDNYAEYSDLFYRQVEILNNKKSEDSFPAPNKFDTERISPQIRIVFSGNKCLYSGCNNGALEGKMFCWDHYQEENYKSK